MTEPGQAPGEDWVGCAVMVLGPAVLERVLVRAAGAARAEIMADPVLADMAAVAAGRWATPDPSADGPVDPAAVAELARAVKQDLLEWVRSGEVEIGTRVTFGLLVVELDRYQAAAEDLVARLAEDEQLSKLPVMFHTGVVSLDGLPPDATEAEAVTVAIPQVQAQLSAAVAATAQEAEHDPEFSLPVDVLRPARQPVTTPETKPEDPGFAVRPAVTYRDVTPFMGGPRADPYDAGVYQEFAPLRGAPPAKPQLPPRIHPEYEAPAAPALWNRARELFKGERTMTAAEQFDSVARSGVPVREVYVVMVGSGRHVPRKVRGDRAEATTEILKRLVVLDEKDPDRRWHIRLFSAGRVLTSHPALPSSARVNRKGLPDQWSEDPEIEECLDALRESIERGRDSFDRRGVKDVGALVVFLATEVPTPAETWLPVITAFHQDVPAFWLLFAQKEKDARATGLPVVTFHDDVIDEVMHRVQAAFTPDEDQVIDLR